MTGWIAGLLPSLQSLGLWSYWIIAAAAMLEAFFVTGVVVPGTLIVDAGGALVRLGQIDFFDLVWFVAIGSAIGGELGYWMGRRAAARLRGRWDPSKSRAYRRAESLFARRGGVALVLGRFAGPAAGFVPLAAAFAGMESRRFRVWNLVSSVPYAFAHVLIGYAAGDILTRIGSRIERIALLALVVAILLGLIWLISAQIRRGLPLALAGMTALRDVMLTQPVVSRWIAAHPGTSRFVARRFDTGRFDGLTLTVLVAMLGYLAVTWADVALDFLYRPEVAATDLRVARLIHAFWSPEALHAFGIITQLGDRTVVLATLLGSLAALAIAGRYASIVQLLAAAAGDFASVRLLKAAFDRPRPELSYYVETSGSFPSGHATLSVAFWGTLVVILWREKVLGATAAIVLGTTLAFLIGFSRLYLIEHFLSDVLNGWILGALWLVIGLTVAEWLRETGWQSRPAPPLRNAAGASLAAATAVAAGWLALTAEPPVAVTRTAPLPALIDPVSLAGTDALPLATEEIDGEPAEPISVILVAPSIAAAEKALVAAGWTQVGPPTAASLVHAAWYEWTGRPDPGAPLLPTFWRSGPEDAGFRSIEFGAELRLWDSRGRTSSGSKVFVGALTPLNEDAEPWKIGDARDNLVATVTTTGDSFVTTAPAEGTAFNGRAWTWDGRAAVLILPDS